MLKIYNTLSRKVEVFKPIKKGNVGVYTCGPTVYDFMHIGNLRTFVFSDILVRTLKQNDYKVTSIQNITDIDDKIITKASSQGIDIHVLTKDYEKSFLEDSASLNILKKDKLTHATDYIDKMTAYIQVLIGKGLAYKEADGSVYFDISKFKNYGKLSRIDMKNLMTGTRILSDEYDKEDVQDFALWKAEKKTDVGYDSPFGWGRPGWHIECSVMSQESLGDTFDIHTGGVDLIFPHHENEIAQSEGKTGKKFVNYFVHGAHILVEGRKMSKSMGNFYTLEDVRKNGFDPLALRYLYLQTHYRQEMNFTWDALSGAQNALDKLRAEYLSYKSTSFACADYYKRFQDALDDDLNTPEALAVMWEMLKSDNPPPAKKLSLEMMDQVFGFGLADYKVEKVKIPNEVHSLVNQREQFRKNENFKEADRIRDKIEKKGFSVDDTDKGPVLKKLKEK